LDLSLLIVLEFFLLIKKVVTFDVLELLLLDISLRVEKPVVWSVSESPEDLKRDHVKVNKDNDQKLFD
jgi:hypothetical protein